MAEGDGEDDKVKRLPVRFKTPSPPERSLLLPFEVGARQCFHKQFLSARARAATAAAA
jgi:hypothetical protein